MCIVPAGACEFLGTKDSMTEAEQLKSDHPGPRATRRYGSCGTATQRRPRSYAIRSGAEIEPAVDPDFEEAGFDGYLKSDLRQP